MAKLNGQQLVPIQVAGGAPPLHKRLMQAVTYALSGGYFSPESPQTPSQQKTAGRAFDYPSGYNLYVQPRRDTGVTFETLRQFADAYDILRIVIETRKDQISAFEWSIVPTDEGAVLGVAADPVLAPRIKQVTDLFNRPDGRLSWHSWLRAVLEDLFVLDAVVLFPTFKGTQLAALERVAAETIKIVINEQGRTPDPPYPAYQQVIKGIAASNYTREELCYFMRNHRNNKIYGFSPVEQILMTVQIGMRRELTQMQWFTEGNVPEAIAGVPDSWTGEQIAQFQQWWDTMMEGDTAQRRHLKFVPTDASKIQMLKTSEDTLKTPFDEWLVRIVCYAFSTSPTPFVQQTNRATAQTVQDTANEEGLVPMLDFLREVFNVIIRDVMKVEGVEFRWNLTEDMDPVSQSTVDMVYLEHGVIGIDDIRKRKGLEPLGVKPMVWASAGPIPLESIIDGSAQYLQPPPAPSPGGFGGEGDDTAPDGDSPIPHGKPQERAEKKEASSRTATPFQYGALAKSSSPIAQTRARLKRGGRHLVPR